MRFFRAFLFVVLVTVLALVTTTLRSDPEHVKPDHVAPPAAEALGTPLPLVAVGGDLPDVNAMKEWFDGVARAEWFAGVQAELDRQAREAAARAVSRRAGSSGGVGGDCAAIAAEFGLPPRILERESGCGTNNWNGTGCGGRGCIGPTQLDLGHFAERSPWGGVGACVGLDPESRADQIECTNRLSGGGSNLAPWGG